MARRKQSALTPKHVDVAIVVALPEEYTIFSQNSFFRTANTGVTLGGVGVTHFLFKDAGGREREGIFVRVDGMGGLARDAVYKVHTLYDATYWISAGISGALSSDVHPGDVILSDIVLNPIELSKALPSESGFELKIGGGRPTVGSADINTVAQKWRDDNETRRSFERDCQTRLSAQIDKHEGEERAKLEDALIPFRRREPNLHVGPIAGGPVLSAAKQFKDIILGSNRKLLAYDMETNEVGAALSGLNESGRFIAVRTVSDYGDAGKNAFEEATKGIVRSWALKGLTDFLVFTLRRGLPYPKRERQPLARVLHVAESSQIATPSLHFGARLNPDPMSDAWDMRYGALVGGDAVPELNAPVSELSAALGAAQDGKRITIVVSGPAGSGKSALLNLLKSRWAGIEPIHIDVGDSAAWRGDPDEPAEIAAKQYVEQLGLPSNEPTLIVVDDIDMESAADRALVGELDRVADRAQRCCLVFGMLSSEPRLEQFAEGVNVDFWVPLRTTSPGMPRYGAFIASFENVLKDVRPPISLSALRGRIETLGPRSIDPQFVSVLVENWANARFSAAKTAVQFAIETANLLGNSVGEGLPTDFIGRCAADAFTRYSGEASPQLAYGAYSKAFLKVRQTGEWLQDALVAQFVVRAIIRFGDRHPLDKLERSALERVYDTRVSGLVKQIVQTRENGPIMKGVEGLLQEQDVSIAPFLVYILGRISDPQYKPQALRLLQKLRDASISEFAGWKNTYQDARLTALAHRAVFISRAYQNDFGSAQKYVALLAKDPDESSRNRGFHVEYYRDRVVRPKEGNDGYMLSDDASGPWANTYDVLHRSIAEELDAGALTAKGLIELGTFCSFVAVRLDRGELASGLRAPIKTILTRALQRGKAGPVLNGVCSAMLHELDQPPRTGAYALFETVYRLKHEERAGWRARKISERLGQPAERVASHIYGACLIALWLLPEKPSEEFHYNKIRVIKLLMLHDVGEAVIGDQTPGERGVEPGDEAQAVARIAGMAMMPALNNLHDLYEDWQDFEDILSNEAKVARDIDYLEALMQAVLYRPHFPNGEDYEDFVRYHRERIRTPPGRSILDAITRGAELAASSGSGTLAQS